MSRFNICEGGGIREQKYASVVNEYLFEIRQLEPQCDRCLEYLGSEYCVSRSKKVSLESCIRWNVGEEVKAYHIRY